MDVRQFGPALFATVKQVRRLLDEDGPVPARSGGGARVPDASGGSAEDGRGGGAGHK